MTEWLITDTHFNHKGALKWGRPEGFEEQIIANCQKLIQPNDLVFHLGDVIFAQRGTLKSIMEKLPGRWVLIKGNHDQEKSSWYMERGFVVVVQSLVYKGVLLSHVPRPELPPDAILNVHGHLHNTHHHDEEFNLKPFNKLLAIELTDYSPVKFDDFAGEGQKP